ncbi:hypothetical protein [Rossellomorea vietnamensis]|uniref:hypothetical protein n=1 Tax=Rossellomorea vietnamensis TaxID=218284 RepID=UPI0005501F5B|nr:hypothetical protein [Rossellomorea vietnamensis]
MTKYLSFEGSTSYLKLPVLTLDKIVLDVYVDVANNPASPVRYLFDARTGVTNALIYNGSYSSGIGTPLNVFINDDSTVVNQVTKWIDIPKSVRQKMFISPSSNGVTFTDDITVFSHNNGSSCGIGKLYDVKCYLNGTVIAHYDMSTGTVQDQSGNGNHATLVGGTWVDDGTGGTPTEMTGSSTLKGSGILDVNGQLIKNATVVLSGTGELEATGEKVTVITSSAILTAKGIIEAAGNREVNVSSALVGSGLLEISVGDVTVITASANLIGVGNLIAEGIRIVNASADIIGDGDLYAHGERIVQSGAVLNGTGLFEATSQRIVIADAELIASGKLNIIQGEPIIGKIPIRGRRELYVYLVGKRELFAPIKAKRELYINLRGDLNVTIENALIKMFAGDTKYLPIEIEGVSDFSGSILKWAFMKSIYQPDILLMKTFDDGVTIVEGQPHVKLNPEDTMNISGKHYYEVEFTDAIGNVSTVATGQIDIMKSGV